MQDMCNGLSYIIDLKMYSEHNDTLKINIQTHVILSFRDCLRIKHYNFKLLIYHTNFFSRQVLTTWLVM